MKLHLIWATVAVLAIAAISHCTMQSDIEDAKQKGFLGKACVDAGGQWQHEWGPHYNCLRPK